MGTRLKNGYVACEISIQYDEPSKIFVLMLYFLFTQFNFHFRFGFYTATISVELLQNSLYILKRKLRREIIATFGPKYTYYVGQSNKV